jgi:uncharacterized protein (TIGR00661 family)
MAKIIYAVAGEGFGHSSRSHLIGQRFIDAGHEVMFVGSQKSLIYLKQYFGQSVKEIFGLAFAFDNRRVDPVETLKKNLVKLPEANRTNDELFKKHFEPFGPELIISDFEPFSAWWAWRNSVPFLSIDHEHFLTLCKLEHKTRNWFSRMTSSVVTECYYAGAVSYVILNFFRAHVKIDSAYLAPPVVRPAVVALKPSDGKHVLMYSTAGQGLEILCDTLNQFASYSFVVYGFDSDEQIKNCTFKRRSTDGFLTDLASCAGVIASAGFSLISECMFLRKKMLLLPLAGQYEQIINAQYIEKLGLGICAEQVDGTAIKHFLDGIEQPMPDDEKIIWPDNDAFFAMLQQRLDQLHTPISITI